LSVTIHPSAVVDSEARIGRDVQIGAYAFIGPDVELGDGCRIHHHATIEGCTSLGENCELFPQAILGTPPQDLKYRGERTRLEIGKNNIFREMVTVHPGTDNGAGITRIGDNNLFLIGVHVAHDCIIGSRCVIANYVQFAGHVHVEDFVNMGGHSAVHHFVTIGKYAFIGGMTRVTADVPPYVVVVAARGTRSEIRMINGVGLERNGFASQDIQALKDAYMKLFSRRARMNGTAIRDRVQGLLDMPTLNPHVAELCNFLMRSFAHGRHGRYLESLRRDAVHRGTWKPKVQYKLSVDVHGSGRVEKQVRDRANHSHEVVELKALADPGWTFSGWNGSLTGQDNPQRVTLDRDLAVAATFTRAT
jgi:UDP-N-acetylglucosamine acyltransferase